jgi:hypothetical protein
MPIKRIQLPTSWRPVTNDFPLGQETTWLRSEKKRLEAKGRRCRINQVTSERQDCACERLEVAETL